MKRTKENPRRERGFTLVELIVVVTILALLMGLFAPKVIGRLKGSQTKIAKMQLAKIKTAIDRASLDTGRYPTSDEGLRILAQSVVNVDNWSGPYLEPENLKDPWGREFVYRYPCQHGGRHEYDLFSLGPDGMESPGDGGDDIRSWE